MKFLLLKFYPSTPYRVATILESPGISLIFAESPGKVLEFYTAPSMSFSNSRTFQDCGKCYIIFYIAVVYFSILICNFVLVTPCYITCWKNSVFLFFAYSGDSKSPGISKKVLEKSWKLECKSPGKSEKKSWKTWKVLEFDIKFSWQPCPSTEVLFIGLYLCFTCGEFKEFRI